MSELKVAIIGCGGHAQHHFRMVAGEPRLRLVALAELDDQRREKNRVEHGPERAFADYRSMLDTTQVDVVYVCTMPGHITPIVTECLDRGLNTSVEKPPGMNLEDTKALAGVAALSRGKDMVSFNRRYFPEVLAIRRMVQERGGAVHCAATYNKPLTALGSKVWAEIAPAPVICDAIHHVDLLRWLAGSAPEQAAMPTMVYSEVQDGERETAHRHNAVLKFDSGIISTFMSHYGVGFRIQRAEVHAEDFSAYLDLTGRVSSEIYQAKGSPVNGDPRGERLEKGLDLDVVGGADFNETVHFVDCILEDRTPWSTLADAVHTMHLCEAIRRGHKGVLPPI